MKKLYFLALLSLIALTDKQVCANEQTHDRETATLESHLTPEEIAFLNKRQYEDNAFSFMFQNEFFKIYLSINDTLKIIQEKITEQTGICPQDQLINGQPLTLDVIVRRLKNIFQKQQKSINSKNYVIYNLFTDAQTLANLNKLLKYNLINNPTHTDWPIKNLRHHQNKLDMEVS